MGFVHLPNSKHLSSWCPGQFELSSKNYDLGLIWSKAEHLEEVSGPFKQFENMTSTQGKPF